MSLAQLGPSLPVHRQPIHPQILIRIVTATNPLYNALYIVQCTIHCTILDYTTSKCVLDLHYVSATLQYPTSLELHCSALHSTLQQCSCSAQWWQARREGGRPSNANCRSSNFSLCIFLSSPPRIFCRIYTAHFPLSVTKKSSRGLNSLLQLSPFDHLLPHDWMRRSPTWKRTVTFCFSFLAPLHSTNLLQKNLLFPFNKISFAQLRFGPQFSFQALL